LFVRLKRDNNLILDFKRVYNWFNNKKLKASIRQKKTLKGTEKNASSGSSKLFFQPKAKGDEDDMPDLKLGRHKIRQFKREDIVLHLYQKEIEELATKACNGNRGGFKWINERSAIIENKFKCSTEDGFTEDEIRKIDNEVQQWNERELPASIQAKYILYLFFFHLISNYCFIY
jgi:hypothetical protein